MRFLLDENLHPTTALTLSALGADQGDDFNYLTSVAQPGTPDEDIPGICQSSGFDALITVNYKDFGAKKILYQSLMDNGTNVIVVRPGKMKFRPNAQVSVLALHYPTYRRYIGEATAASETALVKVTVTTCEKRTLSELVAEFTQQTGLP